MKLQYAFLFFTMTLVSSRCLANTFTFLNVSGSDTIDGSDLLINLPPINTDYSVLRYLMPKDIQKPQVDVSGAVEILTNTSFNNHALVNASLARTELNGVFSFNNYIHFYADIGVKSKNQQLILNSGFMTIGDLNHSPFYSSIGNNYIPFGSYVSDVLDVILPIPVSVGAIQANTINLGYHSQNESGISANIYSYQPKVKTKQQTINAGINLDYFTVIKKIKIKTGISYVNNLSNSLGASPLFENNYCLQYAVPGADIRLALSYQSYALHLEYLTSLRDYAKTDMSYNRLPAKPATIHLEFSKDLESGLHPSSVAIGVSHSYQALALNIPKQRFYTSYSIYLRKHLNLAFELNLDKNYAANDSAMAAGKVIQENGKQVITGFMTLSYAF
ncbi:MAG: hypothetical protein A3F67_08215 [Verrucomicrobia bacterium RIFCSPHIGHO2_12_FULL_41_10]|nr:MAG: hypothetical protein A3F67_08215 [Verrucomicrobia bacterium RIFCSPHIGHO2_12_FULL_41_10]